MAMLVHIQATEFQGSRGSARGHSPWTGGVADRSLPGSMRPFLSWVATPACFHPEQSQGLLGPHLQGREAQALL